MNIFKTLFSVGLILSAVPATASKEAVPTSKDAVSASDYVAAMCRLSGDWSGKFEQYDETGLVRSSRLDVGFQCQPGNQLLMETNVFYQDDRKAFSTLKVIFPAKKKSTMHMSYFYGGLKKDYFFKATAIEHDNDTHWTSVRESMKRLDESDNKQTASRYTHIRKGNKLTMIREVKPDYASNDWTLSSKLVLESQP